MLRDVPESPSFVVFPANDRLYEVEFGNQIEKIIIGCNAKVANKPAKKEVTKAVGKGVLGLEVEQNRAMQGDAGYQLIESYHSYHDFNADYIVTTYARSKQVRIIKRETEEVLASIDLKTGNTPLSESAYYRRRIAGALNKLGVSNVPTALYVP